MRGSNKVKKKSFCVWESTNWTLKGDFMLNIQRLEGGEGILSGKERNTSKGTKAR